MSPAVATLVIYAYSSLVSSWGIGPDVKSLFEKDCHCVVQFVDVGNSGQILSRLKLEGAKTQADLAVGFDGATLFRVRREVGWTQFVPFDQSPLAFIYDTENFKGVPPRSLDDLLRPEFKGQIAIEDPRFSSVGLAFLLWVVKAKGEGAWAYLEKLKPQLKVVSPSWDLAYGLFKKGQVQLVLSYWTSPAYHIQEESRFHFHGAPFSKGHYVQSEFLAVNPKAKNLKLAKKFAAFFVSKEIQELIMKKQFMYPINSKAKFTPAFEKLGVAKKLAPLPQSEIEKNLDLWLKKWREIFS